MSAVARSVFFYAIYTTGLGLALLLIPNVPLPIFGIPQAQEVWIRVAGMTVLFLTAFYFISARNEYRQILVASVVVRFLVPVFFAAFAIAGLSSWNLLLLTPGDLLFALWTIYEIRRDSSSPIAARAAA